MNYNTTTQNTTFDVYKADIDLVVIVFDEVYGEQIEVVVYASVDGEYNLTIAGDLALVTVKDNFAYFEYDPLDAGIYEANVSFAGNSNYNPAFDNTTFTVYTTGTLFELEVNHEIIYGETAIVTHTLSEGATGTIKYYLNNGTFLGELDVNKNLTLPVLDAGYYVIIGNYSGDHNFISAKDTTYIKINPAHNNAVVTVSNVTYGEKSLIEITADIDGIYNVNINGTVYSIIVNNGIGSKSISLNAGIYYANLTFNTRNYNTTTNNATFEVYKAATNIFITASNTIYPQGVEGFVYSDVDGEYNLTIGEYSTIVTVKYGSGEFNTDVLDAGNYTVVVTYPGDENHKSNSSSRKVTVEKLTPNITLKVSDIDYGGVAVITINCDIEGSVNVAVNGITETLELNGQMKQRLMASARSTSKYMHTATLSLYNLDSGPYPVTVTYNGNKNIESVSVNGNFNVNALNTTMDIDACDINVGDDEKITVTLPKGATGNVTVNVDGKNYSAPIKDGKAVIKIPNLRAGHKTAKVYYSGSRNYNPTMETASFTVNKIKPNMTSESNDPIGSGKKLHIVVKLPVDATGTVSIVIDGKKYTSPVKAGKALFDIEGLAAGKYDVTAYYSGDDKYYLDQIKLTVTVNDNGNNHKNHTNNDTPDNKGNDASDILKDKIAMRKTGIPVYWLVLALLMMVTGLLPNKRSKK